MQTDEEVGKVAQAVPIIIYILFKINILTVFLNFLNVHLSQVHLNFRLWLLCLLFERNCFLNNAYLEL